MTQYPARGLHKLAPLALLISAACSSSVTDPPAPSEAPFGTQSSALVAPRGLAGDVWADAIFGQSSFGDIMPNRVTSKRLFNPGGVVVDRSVRPNRMYVYDANSRVLGFNHLGHVASGANAGKPCTSNSDFPGSTCVIEEDRGADLVLGQSSMDHSGCNGDGNFQSYPDRAAASASTLCSMPESQLSTTEGGSFANMAVDASGNLYVPDYFNNRILMYVSPFATDTIADDVWGQADFTGKECNRGAGMGAPSAQSLCIASPNSNGFVGGVDIDASGNLWVADNANQRVLRFPRDPATGRPSHTANLVLGQPDMVHASAGEGTNQMWAPAAVRVQGTRVWVADSQQGNNNAPNCNYSCLGRVTWFDNPTTGMSYSGKLNYDFNMPTGLEIDPATGGVWISDRINNELLLFVNGAVQKVLFKDVATPTRSCGGNYHTDGVSFLYDGNPGEPVDPGNLCEAAGSIGIDSDNNVFVAASGFVQDVWRFPSPFPSPQVGISHGADARLFKPYQFAVANTTTQGSLWAPRGVAAVGQQLIVADQGRILFWNNPSTGLNGRDADGLVGTSDARAMRGPSFGRIREDKSSRLWALRDTQIQAFSLPLANQAQPSLVINSPLSVLGGGSVSWGNGIAAAGGIAVSPSGAQVWIADPDNHRVFRINKATTAPVVDVVLGTAPGATASCNQGTARAANTLCRPGAVALDPQGNLWVSDHTLEADGNLRLLEFNASLFPATPATRILGTAASRALGTGGSLTGGCIPPMCGPWEPAFSSDGQMVVGFNPYVGGSRFPLVFKQPLVNDNYVELKDYSSMSYAATFDATNNLYVADLDRGRTLFYKTPLGTTSQYEAESNAGQAGVQFETCADTGGGQDAGFISNGSYIQWTVNAPTAGAYTVTTRSATWATASLQVSIDTVLQASLSLPSTWNGSGAQYQTWGSFTTSTFNLSAGSHTLRVTFTSGSQNLNWIKLNPAAQTCTSVSLARVGATSSSNENANLGPALAIDGNAGTRWASAFSDPQSLTVDLGADRYLDRATLSWEAAAGKNYQLQVSSNGTTFTTVRTITGAAAGPRTDTLSGLAARGRYVRMLGSARTTAYGYSLYELSLLGDNNPNCTP